MTRTMQNLLAGCALAFSAAALADQSLQGDTVHQQYLHDRAACMNMAPGEVQKTCLREAGAAQQAARRNQLAGGDADYERNRLARCAVHKNPTERSYCERRMHGEGTTSGSIEGGGILRELVVTVPADSPN